MVVAPPDAVDCLLDSLQCELGHPVFECDRPDGEPWRSQPAGGTIVLRAADRLTAAALSTAGLISRAS